MSEQAQALKWLGVGLLAVELVHLWVMFEQWPGWPLLLVALYIVIGAALLRLKQAFWVGLILAQVVMLGLRPLDQANHHFVLTYAMMIMALAASQPAPLWLIGQSARWLFVVVMGMASLQKLLSETFRDGSFMAYLLATGGLGRGLWGGLAQAHDVTHHNSLRFERWASLAPPALSERLVWPWGSLVVWGQVSAAVTLGAEVALTVAFAFWPKHKLTHVALLVFLGGLGLIRQEFVFIALVAWLGLATSAQIDEPRRREAWAYGLLIVAALGAALVLGR